MNEGKRFEDNFYKSCGAQKINVDRIPDSMSGFAGQNSICDFTVFKENLFYLELKTVRIGQRFNFSSNIRVNQYDGLQEKLEYKKVIPGYIIKYYDTETPTNSKAFFMHQTTLTRKRADTNKGVSYQCCNKKSFSLKEAEEYLIPVKGQVKTVNYDWDVRYLLEELIERKALNVWLLKKIK